MKRHYQKFSWPLIVALLLTALTACQAEEAPAATESAEIESIAAEEEVVPTIESAVTFFTGDATPVPEPIVLEGALVTESGLQYLEMTAGEGDAPQAGDIVTMEVVGSLADGTELVNTYAQGTPAIAILGREQLLPGWEEGIMLMNVGGSAQLVLPAELAFGEEGYGMIPPNAQLIMEITLISVEAPPVPSEVATDEMVTTESGLQYYDLVEGDGEVAEANSNVTTNYTLWVQGEEENTFIVSSDGNQPVSFVIGRGDVVFPGWDEGVTGMKSNGKRLLVIPADLALGETGSGEIPANATLIMEIELLDVFNPPTITEIDPEEFTTTESGLQYYDIIAGDGATPEAGQTVVVHYTGWLADGTMFDSSLTRGEPFSFVLGDGFVIAGWDEGVATMQVGSTRQLIIPPDLAYGENGAGGLIPPDATLVFEIELLEIQETE